MKTNKIKQWSGRDPIQCRGIYGKPFNYVPKWKLFIQSNYDISFGGGDTKAMIERNKVTEFPFSFIDKPINKNEKKIDVELKERISGPGYELAFFHILLEHYKEIIKNKKVIEEPESVKEQTKIFFVSSDPFTPFFEDIIIKNGDDKKYIKSSELLATFKKYYSDGSAKMNAQEFKSSLISKGLKPSVLKGCIVWRGIEINFKKLKQITESKENLDFTDE